MAPFGIKKLPDLRNLKLTLETLMKNYPKHAIIAADSHHNPHTFKSVHAFVLFRPENCDINDNVCGLKTKDSISGEMERLTPIARGKILGKGNQFVLKTSPTTSLDEGPVQSELSGYIFSSNMAVDLNVKHYYMVIDSQRIHDFLVHGLKPKTQYKIDVKRVASLSQTVYASHGSVVLVKSKQLKVADNLNKLVIGKVTEEEFLNEYYRLTTYRNYSTSASTKEDNYK